MDLAQALRAKGKAAASSDDDDAVAEAFGDAKAAFEKGDARGFARALVTLRTLTDDEE